MKNCFKTLVAAFVSLAGVTTLKATVFDSSYSTIDYIDAKQITDMIVGPGVTVHPTGWKLTDTLQRQIGLFSKLNSPAVPTFTNGVILSTGSISQGNSVSNLSTRTRLNDEVSNPFITGEPPITDPDLDELFSDSFYDPAGFVLYIQPKNKTINIPYIMASEEFYYGASKTNDYEAEDYEYGFDRFAFFFQEVKIDNDGNVDDEFWPMTNNIALLPTGEYVNIATVNPCKNAEYFCSNMGAVDEEGNFILPAENICLPMEFNGAITGLVAVAENLETNKVYKLKIVIGDAESYYYEEDDEIDTSLLRNSLLFLRERGITSGADLKVDVTGPAEALTEPGEVTFTNTVSNIGPAIADDVVVTNSLPEGATYVGCDCDPSALSFVTNNLGVTNGLVWVIGNRFRPNSNAVMRVRCNLPDVAKTYTDSALVVTSTGDYDEKNNRAEADADVGGERREFDVYAVTVSKKYGEDYCRSGLEFIDRITGTNEMDCVQGIKVTFTNQQNEVAWPTNATAPAGTYKIFLSKIEGLPPNAIIRYHEGDLTNECRAITIKANDTNKVYGTSIDLSTVKDAFTVLDEGDGLAAGERVTAVSIKSPLALDTSTPAGTNYNAITLVKPFEVIGEGGFDPNNYVITPSNGTLVVDKRKITIVAPDKEKDYGQENYTLTGRLPRDYQPQGDGLAPGDRIDSLDLKCVDGVALTATCGVYKVTVEGVNFDTGNLDNYEITTVDGELYVNAIELVIIASDTNKVYGSELTFLGTEFTTEPPMKSWDAVTNVDLTSIGSVQTATSGVYAIKAANATGIGLKNYSIDPITGYRDGTLTVTNAPLVIIANDTNKVYGAEFSFTGDEYKTIPEVLYNTDEITNLTLTSEGTNRLAVCDEYEIVVTNAFGIGLENYDITYLYGTLTVTNAPLMIIANSMERMYGEEFAGFQGTEFTTIPEAENLPNGESVTKVTLSCTLATNKFVEVGEYREDIVPSHIVLGTPGFSTNNYDIVFSNGTLTVTNAHLTITANTTNKVYGQSRPFTGTEFAITKGNLLDGDTITNVTLTCFATNAMAGCSNHVIGVSHADGWRVGNYKITYVPGEFKVKPFEITITADDTNKVYGSTVRFSGTEFSTVPKVEDFPNGETVTNVTLTSVGTNVSASVTNKYDIIPGHVVFGGNGFHTNNYDISFEIGKLTVTQALLTVKASDVTWHIKKPRPSYGFENFSSQLAEGDTVADVTGGSGAGSDLEYTNRVWATEEPDKGEEGVYSNEIWIVLSSFDGPRATNYVINVEPGDLTVDAALPELKTSLTWELNGKGLFEGTLKVVNTGDGEADADSDYWVELIPGPATNGTKVSVPHAYYLASRTGTIPGGPNSSTNDYVYEYQDLTEKVKASLRAKYGHSEFGTNESVTVTGINVYHWKRYNPSKGYFDTNAFFVVGHLYNPSDKNLDFRVSEDEKKGAKSLLENLEKGVSDYLEMSRLRLLPYYHWNTSEQTWK